MKINEVVLNEGVLDSLKQAGGAVKKTWNDPKTQAALQKVGDMGADAADWVKGKVYQQTGLGGKGGNTAATRTKFVNDFAQQYKLAQRSARQGGVEFSVPDYVQSYLRRYNWFATPDQLQQVSKVADPTQLANAIYAIGMQQSRDKYGNVDTKQKSSTPAAPADNSGAAAMGNMAQQLTGQGNSSTASAGQGAMANMASQLTSPASQQAQNPEDTTIEPQTQQVLKTVKNLKGDKYEKDLEEIVKLALWNLYGTDKKDYGEFVKSIMAGKTKTNPAQQQQQAGPRPGQIEPTL